MVFRSQAIRERIAQGSLQTGSPICPGFHPRLQDTRRRRKQTAGAFTLIEILVVVAIIALLISILLPSLKRARDQAKVVACRAHMHDLGNSMNMYADQYRNFYPANHDPFLDSFYPLWLARLLKDPQVLVCPSTKNVVNPKTIRKPITTADYALTIGFPEDPPTLKFPFIPTDNTTRISSWAGDGSGGHSFEYLAAYQKTSASWSRRKSIPFYFPLSDMLIVHDADNTPPAFVTNKGLGCSGSLDISGDPGNNCPQPWDNHGAEGMNMLFADGHAQFTRKVAGLYRDYSKSPPTSKQDENASIDRIWQKASSPWVFVKR